MPRPASLCACSFIALRTGVSSVIDVNRPPKILTPVECEARVLGLVVPPSLYLVLAGTSNL